MTCLYCHGQRKSYGLFPPVAVKCDACANGEVDDDFAVRYAEGQVLRQLRLAQNLSLRQFCIQNNLDPILRSRQERGLK